MTDLYQAGERLRPAEYAERFGVALSTVQRWLGRGLQIPYVARIERVNPPSLARARYVLVLGEPGQ
ncbi:MAG: hypothetical protein CMK74_01105 [Pseudomonadales bacterium]|jgi:hypothetical protein|nr:hypothetical protein [Pseudomonadales bacterium]|tara:strand:- start:65 stop:262 length:198 start_codon:yes stop_codon:yes gene_type:complete